MNNSKGGESYSEAMERSFWRFIQSRINRLSKNTDTDGKWKTEEKATKIWLGRSKHKSEKKGRARNMGENNKRKFEVANDILEWSKRNRQI